MKPRLMVMAAVREVHENIGPLRAYLTMAEDTNAYRPIVLQRRCCIAPSTFIKVYAKPRLEAATFFG